MAEPYRDPNASSPGVFSLSYKQSDVAAEGMSETAPAPCLTLRLTPRMTHRFFVSFVVSFAHD
ncbi:MULTISPECIES: hypothetical protein [unclassified Sphingomonas]|uniref:hypothetical protein n=1 Tax=unclassified Sphingomonas TaxID=196159 RepID=UPI0021512D1B|nr:MULTISPECIES: hypothetical protein [unclassified Sphingomonas]MCR5869603.1 hypothetical protein [Sphingomonas sp. J344]UUX98681.1 hypothetical protein LRS08_14230 [Sphingomonas sp. J315]